MRGVISIEANQSNTDDGDVDENYWDAPSSTDNSDNEGGNHEANGDSDNADNESSNNENDPPIANALRNPDYNVVHVDHIVDADNRGHDSDNEEEVHSDSQPQEYDWNYAEQESISDSDEYDWNFGCEEDQAGTNNSSQNINTTTQTTNAVGSFDSASANQGENQIDPKDHKNPSEVKENAEKDEKKDVTNEPNTSVDINDQSSKSNELAKVENENLILFHSLELDESKNTKTDSMSSADNPINAVGISAIQNEQTDAIDENKMSNDAAKDTSELKFGGTSHDCGRGAIRRTVQSSNRGRDIVNSTSRTAVRKSNQYYYTNKKSSFGDSDDYSLRGFEQDYNYADYINLCASSYTASNPIESDNFSGYRSPNLSRYGNLNSPGFGDSGEHSYEAEHSAVHEAPVNPEHGTIQTPAYSTSGTRYSSDGNSTSLSFGSPVSPSHSIQHTSSGFNTSGYDVPGWSDHRAPYSSPYEGPRLLIYAAPEISSYNTNVPEYSSSRSSRSPQYASVGSSGFFAPGSSAYDVSASSCYGVSGLTGYVPSRSSNYEVPASAQYSVPGYSTYGPLPSSSWTSGSSGSEYSTLAPSGYSAPISASYGAPELFDYRTPNSYGYSTQGTPVYDVPGYYGYSADYSSFGYCNIGSSGYGASMSPGYDVSAGYCPSMSSTYSTTQSSSRSASLAPDYGNPHAIHRAGYTIPPPSAYRDPGSSGYGISNLSVCVPVSSHYGPPAFSGFSASRSTGHGISRASRYGAPSMPGISPSGVGLGPLAKFDEGIKCGNKANKRDKAFSRGQRENIANYPGSMFDLGTGPSTGIGYREFGSIAEAIAHDQGAGPVPGPGYGRGRPIRRGRSQTSGPIVPLQEIGNNREQMHQYGPIIGQRPLIEEIPEPGPQEPEQTGRGRGRGRGRRETRDGN